LKYFTGIVAGIWVLSFDWVVACVKAGTVLIPPSVLLYIHMSIFLSFYPYVCLSLFSTTTCLSFPDDADTSVTSLGALVPEDGFIVRGDPNAVGMLSSFFLFVVFSLVLSYFIF
jgi:hypothetical protein